MTIVNQNSAKIFTKCYKCITNCSLFVYFKNFTPPEKHSLTLSPSPAPHGAGVGLLHILNKEIFRWKCYFHVPLYLCTRYQKKKRNRHDVTHHEVNTRKKT